MASESTESNPRTEFGNCGTEWSTLTAALEKRDGAALGRVLKTHLRNKCETVKESFLAHG